MSIINNSHAIGVDTRNLVLKTRGTLHVKVGDRFYEIDFRNLSGNNENRESIKEDYILSVDSRDEVDKLEYPGDNKLIVGLDGSLFITKNNALIDVTPKSSINNSESQLLPTSEVTHIKSASVSGRLYNDNGYSFDFENGEVVVRTLEVADEVIFPDSTIKNKCCKTFYDNETQQVVTNYENYDFVEITEAPKLFVFKSGAMVKSSIDLTIPVYITNILYGDFTFEKDGLYIVYLQNKEIIITKLN